MKLSIIVEVQGKGKGKLGNEKIAHDQINENNKMFSKEGNKSKNRRNKIKYKLSLDKYDQRNNMV